MPGGGGQRDELLAEQAGLLISAIALAGRRTPPFTSMVTFAVQLPDGRKILVTRPTATSLTITAD